MLKNIDKHYSIIHIAGREYRIRYSLNALLCLEILYKPYFSSPNIETAFRSMILKEISCHKPVSQL